MPTAPPGRADSSQHPWVSAFVPNHSPTHIYPGEKPETERHTWRTGKASRWGGGTRGATEHLHSPGSCDYHLAEATLPHSMECGKLLFRLKKNYCLPNTIISEQLAVPKQDRCMHWAVSSPERASSQTAGEPQSMLIRGGVGMHIKITVAITLLW